MLCADMTLFCMALLLSYALRFTFEIPSGELDGMLSILPMVLSIKLLVFSFLGVYRGMWRYTSIGDAARLAKASVFASVLIISILAIISRFEGYPRAVLLADCIFTIFLCGGFRIGIRLLCMRHMQLLLFMSGRAFPADYGLVSEDERAIRLLIVGAGSAADMLIREIQAKFRSPYKIVCCVDDAISKRGCTLHGIPVWGPIASLPQLAKRCNAMEIIIAMPSAMGNDMRRVVEACEKTGLSFKTLPSLSSLIDGRVTVNDLREVNYEDLLGRPPVRLELKDIGKYLTGKTVAVTGAGGSIGSELCRQIVRFHPAALILIDSSEFNLYQIEKNLRIECKYNALYPALGHVQHRQLMLHVFEKYRPQVVFHAAACKHVPMVEMNPWEAVYNNVVGGQVIMDVAEECGAERCVLISTDKAVRPTSVMGASKRIVELLMQSRAQGETLFMAVRFGNVVGSSGSAVPLFQSQIKAGGPVTVTDPEMTRYFMTIPEASQLVLQAGAMGQGGEIFILKMGTPVKIADMARDLIRLSGKEPDLDIKVVYTGLRPGEKLYEELITQGEGIVSTSHEKIMVLMRNDVLDGKQDHARIQALVNELVQVADCFDGQRIQKVLKLLVPEYTPSGFTGFFSGAEQPPRLKIVRSASDIRMPA